MPAGVERGFARALIAADPSAPPPAGAGLGVDLGLGRGRTLMAGEWNSAIYGELADAVRPGDVHCAKNRMSGLWTEAQPLWQHLVAAGTRTLLFTGVNTDQCVLGTLTNAYNAGWDCVLIEDCCGTPTPSGREVCLHNIGFVGLVSSLFFPVVVGGSLKPASAANRRIRQNYGFIVDSETFAVA